MTNLSRHFYDAVKDSVEFNESISLVKTNCQGSAWLIGGFVFRNIADNLYGTGKPEVDLDFIVDRPLDDMVLPGNWRKSFNRYGNPKLVKKNGTSIDFVPIQNVHSIVRRELPATIENFLTGTPLTVQSLAYDINKHEVIGEIGTEALISKTVAVNDTQQAEIYARKKKKTVSDIIQEKASELRFQPVLTE